MSKLWKFWCFLFLGAIIVACSVSGGTSGSGTDSGSGSDGSSTPTPDTTPPTLVISQPTNGQEVGATYTLQGTVSDNASGVQAVYVAVDDDSVFGVVPVVNGSWSTNISLATYGKHTNYVYAEDKASNVTVTNLVEVVRAAVPSLIITSPVEGYLTTNASVTVTGTVSIEAPYSIATVEVSLDGANYVPANVSGIDWSANVNLSEGTNTLHVRATADNGKTTQVTRKVVLDTVVPGVTIIAPAAGSEVSSNYTLSGTVSDNIAYKAVYVKVDNGSWKAVSVVNGNWSTNITLSTYGKHTNYVYAEDLAGNVSAIVEREVEYPVAPVVAFTAPAEGILTNAVAVTFTGTASINAPYSITKVELSLDGVNYTEATHNNGNWSLTLSLAEGTNTIRAKATADNGKTSQVTRKVVLDSTKPTLTVTSHTNFQFVSTNYVLAGSASDQNLDKVMISVNGSSYVQANLVGNSWNYNVAIAGGTLQTNDIYALDKAGNSSVTNRIILTNSARLPWTIMIFMNGDSDLEPNAMEDLNEIEAGLAGGENKVHVVVLVDRSPGDDTSDGDWKGTRLYYMQYDSGGLNGTVISKRLAGMGLSDTGDSDEKNMGDPAVLAAFVDYVKAYFPATNTMLVIWNHGDGWRSKTSSQNIPTILLQKEIMLTSSRKEKTPFSSIFTLPEKETILPSVVSAKRNDVLKGISWDASSGDELYNSEVRTALTGKGITILGADACLMGMLETAYEWRSLAEYLIASPDTTLGDGWEYDQWLPVFLSGSLSKENLYQAIVNAFANRYATIQTSAIAVYDLSKINTLFTAFESYVTNLYNNLLNAAHDLRAPLHFAPVRDTVEAYSAYIHGGYYHVDVYEFADKVTIADGSAVKTALQNAVVYEWHQPGGNIIAGNPNAHGMAVYYCTWLTNSQGDLMIWVRPDYVLSNYTLFNQASLWDLYIDAVGNQFNVPWLFNNVGMVSNFTASGQIRVFQFYVSQPGSIEATLSWSGSMDFDLELYDARTLQRLKYAYTENNPEIITYTITQPGWYLLVAGAYTGTGSFTIKVKGVTAVLK